MSIIDNITQSPANIQPASYVSPVLTQGCDISKWQDDPNTIINIDFAKMKAAGIKFVYIRNTVGDTNDRNFVTAWKGAKDAGLLRGAYHMHYFWLGLSQCQRFLNRLVDDPGELPPAFDLEKGGFGVAKSSAIMARLKDAISYMDTELTLWKRPFGNRILMYTNPDTIKNFFSNNLPAWFLDRELWIAHYKVASPDIGWQFKRWLFWQQTDRMDGLKYGVESKQLDGDVWNGDLNSLRQFCGLDDIPVPPMTIEERLGALEAQAKAHGWAL
jgi:lysozyme